MLITSEQDPAPCLSGNGKSWVCFGSLGRCHSMAQPPGQAQRVRHQHLYAMGNSMSTGAAASDKALVSTLQSDIDRSRSTLQ